MHYKYQTLTTHDHSSFLSGGSSMASLDITDHIFSMAQKSRSQIAPKSRSRPSEFLGNSQLLEDEIRRTSKQLAMLKEMNKKSTLFTNDDTKINDLITDVKQQMNDINKKLMALQKNNDLVYSKQAEKMAKSIYEILNLRFMDITKDFKALLEGRTNSLKQMKEKESFLSLAGSKTSEVRNRKTENAFLKKPFPNSKTRGGPVEYVEQGSGNYGNGSDDGHHGITIQLDNEHLKKKREDAKSIQKSLEEVMGIFTRISSMVQMQEIMIERIDKDMDDSLRNVEGGKKNLVKIYKDLSGTRRLIISVMIFLMVFASIYILII